MSSSFSSEPRRYLIAIGSSKCDSMGLPQLKRVESDIDRVTTLFEAQGYKRVLKNVLFLDENSHIIKDLVGRWFANSDLLSTDCVIVYYSGHGDEGGRFRDHYLFTSDSIEDRLFQTAIRAEDFVRIFFQGQQDKTPHNILLILDVCYANAAGRQISEAVSKLKGVTPMGSGFWVICSSDANTEAGDGAFVEALCAVMDPEREEFQQDGEFIPVETLVSRINHHFKTTEQAQRALADAREIQQETIFFRNPRFETTNDISSPTNRGRSKLLSQLVDCLWSLDYRPQTRVFEDCTCQSRRVAAFVVQAKERQIQNWLVKRLFNQLPNVRNALVFEFVIPAHPMWRNRDFDELWHDFARHPHFKCEANQSTILDRLVEIYQTKPVIIAMYGWRNSQRSQILQEQVLKHFWQPLVKKVKDLPNQPKRSRLILFLAEGATNDSDCSNENELHIPIRLAPLTEIPRDEVADWLDTEGATILREILSEDDIKILIEQDIEEWDADPVQTLEEICYVFDLENGIAELESEWRLVG